MHILSKWLVENMQLLAAYCDASLVGSVYLPSISTSSALAKALQVRARPMVRVRLWEREMAIVMNNIGISNSNIHDSLHGRGGVVYAQ